MKKVSADEKQARIINFIKENDFYHIKDIEKASSKMGISSMIIKDIVEQLCADNKIFAEKSGISNYYFKKNINFEEQILLTENQIKNTEQEILTIENEIAQRRQNIKDVGYDSLVQNNIKLVEEKKILEEKLDLITLDKYKEKEEDILEIKRKINEKTDVIFEVVSFLKNKMSRTESEIYKIFNIQDDFDYVD